MPSGSMQFDGENKNLVEQIQDLQERIAELERLAFTSQDIVANKQVLGLGHPIDKVSDGGLVVAGQSGLPYKATDGTTLQVGGGDIAAADVVVATAFRGAKNQGGVDDTLDQNNLEARIEGFGHNQMDWHYDKTGIPTGLAWQTYSPFATPASGLIVGNSFGYLHTQDIGASGGRKFLAETISDINHMWIMNPFTRSSTGGGLNIGIRLDDASDNNYVVHEWRFNYDASSPGLPEWWFRRRWRTGGGSVSTETLTGTYHRQAHTLFRISVEGTKWSSWSVRPFLYEPGNLPITWLGSRSGFTFTPTRVGVEWYNETAAAVNWQYAGLDAHYWY